MLLVSINLVKKIVAVIMVGNIKKREERTSHLLSFEPPFSL